MDKARIDILIYCGPSTQYSSISSLSGDTYSILELLKRCADHFALSDSELELILCFSV
jgi:hypothetical protein